MVEIESWKRVAIHKSVAETVDAILRGYLANPETRQLSTSGRVEIIDEPEREEARVAATLLSGGARPDRPFWGEPAHRRSGGHVRDHRDAPMFEEREAAPSAPARTENSRAIHLYTYGIPRTRLEAAVRSSGLPVEIVEDIAQADAVLTLRNHYRRSRRQYAMPKSATCRCTW